MIFHISQNALAFSCRFIPFTKLDMGRVLPAYRLCVPMFIHIKAIFAKLQNKKFPGSGLF